MIASVVIATRNRAALLSRVLQSLSNIQSPAGDRGDQGWEIIVVDNASTDHTRAVVLEYQVHARVGVRYCHEPLAGKSIALNTGIEAARGDFIAFTDDDCLPDPCWLFHLCREFQAVGNCAVIGGRVELFAADDCPLAVQSEPDRHFAQSLAELYSPLLLGCNLAVGRAALRQIGCFDTRLGPGATTRAVAEDIDFVYRAFRHGIPVLYSPEVLVYHGHGRQSQAEIETARYGYSAGRGALYCKYATDSQVLRMAYWEFLVLVRELVRNLMAGKSTRPRRIQFRGLLAGASQMAAERLFH